MKGRAIECGLEAGAADGGLCSDWIGPACQYWRAAQHAGLRLALPAVCGTEEEPVRTSSPQMASSAATATHVTESLHGVVVDLVRETESSFSLEGHPAIFPDREGTN